MNNQITNPRVMEHVAKLYDRNPKVLVTTYKRYDEVDHDGIWLDVSSFDSYEEFMSICKLLYPEEKNPEFMFPNYDEIPCGDWVQEDSIKEDFWKIKEYAEMSLSDQQAFTAYVEAFECDDFEGFYESIVGYYGTEIAFAKDYLDLNYDWSRQPYDITEFYDYEALSDHLLKTDYVFMDGYVFRRR